METLKGVTIPDDLLNALNTDQQCREIFENMRHSCQEKYVAWITETNSEEVRAKRISKTLNQVYKYGERHKMA